MEKVVGIQRSQLGRGTGRMGRVKEVSKGLSKSRDQERVDLTLEILGYACHPSTQEGEAGGHE